MNPSLTAVTALVSGADGQPPTLRLDIQLLIQMILHWAFCHEVINKLSFFFLRRTLGGDEYVRLVSLCAFV